MYYCTQSLGSTLEVLLRVETWERGPLKTSHTRQPRPHTSVDLDTQKEGGKWPTLEKKWHRQICTVEICTVGEINHHESSYGCNCTSIPPHHFSPLLAAPGFPVSGGSYFLRADRILGGGLVSLCGVMNSTPANFHSPAESTNTDETQTLRWTRPQSLDRKLTAFCRGEEEHYESIYTYYRISLNRPRIPNSTSPYHMPLNSIPGWN